MIIAIAAYVVACLAFTVSAGLICKKPSPNPFYEN